MYVKAILPSNIAYYDMAVLPHSIRLSDNVPLDASGNEIPTEQVMIKMGDLLPDAAAVISEISEDPFDEVTEIKSDY
jgi:hypothetical protein